MKAHGDKAAGRGTRAPRSRRGIRLSVAGTLVAFAMLALVSSPSGQGSDEFERIREKAAELVVAVNGSIYDTFGAGKDSKFQRTYGDYGYLLTPKKLEDLKGLITAASTPEEQARRERTTGLLRYHAMHAAAAPLIDNANDALRDNTILVEGDGIVIRGLDRRIALEESEDNRRKWALAARQLYTGINVYLLNLMVDLDAHAKELGFEGYYPFLRQVESWDLELLRTSAESLLVQTEDTYSAGLEKAAERELGQVVRKVRTYNALRMELLPSFSEQVEWQKPMDVAEKTLESLGFELGKQRSLRIDVKERDGREPGALAYQLSTGKTRVTLTPHDFPAVLPEVLGALGEAEFFHSIPNDLPFETAYFGNNILPSVYRALFESIAEEPAWIQEHVKLRDVTVAEFAEALRFRRLVGMRRAAGRCLFQIELHENFHIDAGRFNEIMERALLWRRTTNDADAYLHANDHYRCGGRLVGAIIAAQIRDRLRDEWGDEWFRNPDLAERLRRGAQRGYAMPLDEFLALWDLDAVDVGALLADAS
ncbi:MAG: hypothetical protein KAY32_13225 [Candidatus Eisenbacteria sp.]|nr:hypothetical protein [Candidatus Eisenbacteria bacterium]